jgi:hypothetical protein
MNINSILIALKNGGPGNAFTGNHRGDARWRAASPTRRSKWAESASLYAQSAG